MRNFETIKKYLPSKKFILIICFIAVLLIGYLIVSSLIKKQKEKKELRQQTIEKLTGVTITDLLSKDSDGDGVADWEEDLWGTDKYNKFTFNGILDSEYINRKKREINPDYELANEDLTQTDLFARQFFATFMALQSEGVDNMTINNIASSLGQQITTQQIKDEYTLSQIKVQTEQDLAQYYVEIESIFRKYADLGLGEEIVYLEQNLGEQISASAVENNSLKISEIGMAYQAFAKEASEISTPESIKDLHLKIINSAHKTGGSVLGMAQTTKDPVLGVIGISQYQSYIEDFTKNVNALDQFVDENL
jgi:hypothetical protein